MLLYKLSERLHAKGVPALPDALNMAAESILIQ